METLVMDSLKMMSPEAYQAFGKPVNYSLDQLSFLKSAIKESTRNRSRICTHDNAEEKLHEMFVIYGKDTYVRPNRHFGKDESILVVEGSCDVYFFDLDGKILDIVEMGGVASNLPYYCRIPKEIFHTVVINSEQVILFEATSGPFDPEDTYYADWSPQEGQAVKIASLRQELVEFKLRNRKRKKQKRLFEINQNVYQEKEAICWLSSSDHDFLWEKMKAKNLDRVRICSHQDPSNLLHEMLMLFSHDTYIRPSEHTDKEESLFILEGEGRYVFFDENGNVDEVVALGGPGTGKQNYCRVPKNTYHMLIVDSEYMLVKETTSGPFSRSDTKFPVWAEDYPARQEARPYIESLEKQIGVKFG